MLILQVRVIGDRVVQDTIAAVFRSPDFARDARSSLWTRFVRWLGGVIARFFANTRDHPLGTRVVIALLLALGIAVAVRLAYGAWLARGEGWSRRGATRERAARAGDPWSIARAAAEAGRYLEAAHALYQALLTALVERERVRLHPAKTAGDYVRDLRALRSPLLPRFRDFTRAYEVVAYGTGECDRARYERLLALAAATLDADASAARRGAA
jgi:hypothetical protein